MSANDLTRRARLRSTTLGEGFQHARHRVSALSPENPVVPGASEAQSALEGLITLHGLRYLHGDYPADHDLPGYMKITSLEAHRDALHIHADPRGLATTIAMIGCDPWNDMTNGLRVRDGDRGVQFYRAGHVRPSVTFAGLSTDEFQILHQRERGVHDDCILARPAHALTPEELAADQHWRHDSEPELRAAGSLIRRLGILTGHEPRSVDCWSGFKMVIVECQFPRISEDDAERIVRDLTSRHLDQRWSLVEVRGGESVIGSYLYFDVEGTTAQVQVRLFRSPE